MRVRNQQLDYVQGGSKFDPKSARKHVSRNAVHVEHTLNPRTGDKSDIVETRYRSPISAAHGKTEDVFSNESWAVANYRSGRNACNLLDFSFISGTASDLFSSFIGETEGAGAIFKNGLDAITALCIGKRDDVMYNVYGFGVDKELSRSEELDPEKAVQRHHLECFDDAIEDRMKAAQYGETSLNFLWKWSTKSARVKSIVYPITALFGEKLSSVATLLLETPARLVWRFRFFGSSLQSDFTTKICKLAYHGIAGVFDEGHRGKYKETVSDMNHTARTYFNDQNIRAEENGKKEVQDVSRNTDGLGLSLKMWKHRMSEHWRGVINPKEVLQEKYDQNILDKDNGFSPNEVARQFLSSITDFTGPIFGSLGIIGATVFDPLQTIFKVGDIEKGYSGLTFLSNLRRPASMLHYLSRFIFSEHIDVDAEELTKIKELQDQGESSAALDFYRSAKRHRRFNFGVGLGMTFASLAESAMQAQMWASGEDYSSSPGSNFFYKVVQRFSRYGFLRFFSNRRQFQGAEKFIESYTQHKLGHSATKTMGIEDYKAVSDEASTIQEDAEFRTNHLPHATSRDQAEYATKPIVVYTEKLKQMFSRDKPLARIQVEHGIA